MMEKRTQQILSAALPTNRLADGSPQILNILWNKVSQIRILGTIPYLLHRIKIRRVRRQPFHINATAESSLQPFGAAAMNHPAIHNHDKPSWKMREQLCHKCLKIIGDNVAIMQGKIQSQAFAFGRNSNRGDGRESVSAVPTVMDGSLSSRSPSSSNSWLKHKAAFIQQNKGFAASLGFFLYGANRSFARWLWPARLVRGLCVRAFGNSSPFVSTHAKCWTVRSERQNACKLSRPHVSVSIARWSNRFCGPLSRAAFLIAGFFSRRVEVFFPADCEPEKPSRHGSRMLFSIGLQHHRLPQPVERFGEHHGLVPAAKWPFADAAPVVWLFLLVSYIMLSANYLSFI
jgi:hypothetical protein